ncbi:centrosomal protein of 63 kDa [Stigmatopora argus]
MEACFETLLNSDLSSVLSECKPELQELMQRIDIMMSHERSEWQGQVRDLQLRLKCEQEEMTASRVLLQRKDLEIGVLRKQVEEFQTGRQDLATKYENQLGNVSEELDKLKRSYQKLERRRMRRPPSDEAKSKKDDATEVGMLRDNLEVCRQRLVVYQKQFAEMEVQKKNLSDELMHLKVQHTSEAKHAACCSDVQRMRAQLEKVDHELHTQEVELGRVRALEDNRVAQERKELRDKEEQIARLQNDVSRLKHALHDKEQALRSLEECMTSRDIAGVEKLCKDLARTSEELDCARASESYLNDEVMRVKERLQETSVQHAKLQREHKVLQEAFDSSVADVKKLQDELSRAEEQHGGAVDNRKHAGASSAVSLAPLGESRVIGRDRPQLRPEIAPTTQPGPNQQSSATADSEPTSYDGDIQRLFTQLRMSGSRQPPVGDSAQTERTPEGCNSFSPSSPSAIACRFREQENLRSKELLHKLDADILSLDDSNMAVVAKCGQSS